MSFNAQHIALYPTGYRLLTMTVRSKSAASDWARLLRSVQNAGHKEQFLRCSGFIRKCKLSTLCFAERRKVTGRRAINLSVTGARAYVLARAVLLVSSTPVCQLNPTLQKRAFKFIFNCLQLRSLTPSLPQHLRFPG